jgi:hypothetical protein
VRRQRREPDAVKLSSKHELDDARQVRNVIRFNEDADKV